MDTQRPLAGVDAPPSPIVLTTRPLAHMSPLMRSLEHHDPRRSDDVVVADQYSYAATRASHGSQGDRCSDTSNTGSGETVLADAPRERFTSSAFGPASHRREETARVTAEGRLTDVRIRVEWSPGAPIAQIVLTGEALCQGKTIRCSDRGWRSRPVEASRRLMRELLATIRLSLEGAIVRLGALALDGSRGRCGTRNDDDGYGGDCDDTMGSSSDSGDSVEMGEAGDLGMMVDADGMRQGGGTASSGEWDSCRRALSDIDGAVSPSMGAESSECDEAPGVRIVNIEWANRLRWGGDAMYDPAVDGPISLQGACTLDDPASRVARRERPVWAAYDRREFSTTPTSQLTPPPMRPTWRNLPREAILEAVVRELADVDGAVSVNSWSIDRHVHPGVKRTCDDVSDAGGQTFETILGFRARTALVRIHGHAPPPSRVGA